MKDRIPSILLSLRSVLSLLPVLWLAGSLAGCVKTRSQLKGESGNQELARQTQAQRRFEQQNAHASASASAPAAASAPAPAPKPAIAAYRLEEYDEQMRHLHGRVDTVENMLAQLNAAEQGHREMKLQENQALEQKFIAFEDALKKLETQVLELSDQVSRLKPTPAPAVDTSEKARTSFEQAEDLFTAKKWKESIVAYQKYRDKNPKGKQYADATYKIGVSFQELGMKDEARAFFDEVTTKFPKSKEAKKAKFRLNSLK
ncbi:MAG: tol-pal system YbgF family protein [Bdellovibrionales bacterium]